jgi:hypothetical protein
MPLPRGLTIPTSSVASRISAAELLQGIFLECWLRLTSAICCKKQGSLFSYLFSAVNCLQIIGYNAARRLLVLECLT